VHMVAQKEIDFTKDIPPGIHIYADKALVNIVVRNLVSNAIKFTPHKGSVSIRIFDEGPKVRFEVIDSGVGIKAEILDQFEKNGLMESSSGTDREVGTGLGLQLVKDLVDRSGGVLHIRSTPEKGSIFTFTIPSTNKQE